MIMKDIFHYHDFIKLNNQKSFLTELNRNL
jgi:hypothetical protein